MGFKCAYCKRSFRTMEQLEDHMFDPDGKCYTQSERENADMEIARAESMY